MPGETTESGATAEQPSASGFEDAFEAFAKGETPPAPAADETTGAEPKKDPEPQPDSSEPGDNTGAAAPSAPDQPASDDIDWDTLPAPARKAFERAQQEVRSLKGRQSSLDRQLHELRSTRTAEPTPPAADAPPAKQFDAEQLKALREDYPELAGPLLDVIEGLQAKLDGMSGAVTAVETDRTNEALLRQEAALVDLMPDWKVWGSDKRFDTWITTQPRHVQEAASRNNAVIVDASEAFDVLERFKNAHAAAPAATPDPKRERQLNAGRDATTKTPVAGSGPPDDFEGAFSHFAAKQAGGKR